MRSVVKSSIFKVLLIMTGIILTGCQQNELFEEEVEIVKIEVIDQETDKQIATITDASFIDSLVRELETAQTSDTANIDMESPDYWLLFQDEEENLIQEIGYYIEEKNFGVIGRYHYDGDHFAVTTELPIENE